MNFTHERYNIYYNEKDRVQLVYVMLNSRIYLSSVFC